MAGLDIHTLNISECNGPHSQFGTLGKEDDNSKLKNLRPWTSNLNSGRWKGVSQHSTQLQRIAIHGECGVIHIHNPGWPFTDTAGLNIPAFQSIMNSSCTTMKSLTIKQKGSTSAVRLVIWHDPWVVNKSIGLLSLGTANAFVLSCGELVPLSSNSVLCVVVQWRWLYNRRLNNSRIVPTFPDSQFATDATAVRFGNKMRTDIIDGQEVKLDVTPYVQTHGSTTAEMCVDPLEKISNQCLRPTLRHDLVGARDVGIFGHEAVDITVNEFVNVVASRSEWATSLTCTRSSTRIWDPLLLKKKTLCFTSITNDIFIIPFCHSSYTTNWKSHSVKRIHDWNSRRSASVWTDDKRLEDVRCLCHFLLLNLSLSFSSPWDVFCALCEFTFVSISSTLLINAARSIISSPFKVCAFLATTSFLWQ